MPYTPEEQVNRAKWDEVAPIHLRSYGLEQLRQGRSMLHEIERRELGDLTGKQTLQFQCHIGHDMQDTARLVLCGRRVQLRRISPAMPQAQRSAGHAIGC